MAVREQPAPSDDIREQLRRELRRRLGDAHVAGEWLTTELLDFGGRTPLQVIESSSEGAATVLEYVLRYL